MQLLLMVRTDLVGKKEQWRAGESPEFLLGFGISMYVII